MAFRDLHEGILEEFGSYCGPGDYLRANEDPSYRVKRRAVRDKPVAEWCVVQCRLCATEHSSRASLLRHYAKCHPDGHRYIVRFDKECSAANARAHRGPHVVEVERVQCLHCHKPFGSDDALRLHQRGHHPLEHAAATRTNRALLADVQRTTRGPRWWWQTAS